MCKKAMLILPKFFGYDQEIVNALSSFGFQVTVIYENLDELNLAYRFIYVYGKGLKKPMLENYYNAHCPGDHDLVLVIRGSTLSEKTVCEIKAKNPAAKFILYQWDSVKNTPTALNIAKYFDKVATFDMHDAKNLGWTYRPLFYCQTTNVDTHREYDLAYICSLHSQRIAVLQQIKKYAQGKNLALFSYLFAKKIIYFKQKYFNRNEDFLGLCDEEIRFSSLSLEQTQQIYRKSKIIVDYAHPGQNGFTMRTIESLGHHCKLITNNKNIQYADFYRPENIYIYNMESFEIPDWFLKTPYTPLDDGLFYSYSLTGWLQALLEPMM